MAVARSAVAALERRKKPEATSEPRKKVAPSAAAVSARRLEALSEAVEPSEVAAERAAPSVVAPASAVEMAAALSEVAVRHSAVPAAAEEVVAISATTAKEKATSQGSARKDKKVRLVLEYTYPRLDRGCFNCGEEGHRSNECPNPRKPREGGGGGGKCYNCNGEGHLSRDCTEPRKREFSVRFPRQIV